LGAPLPMHAEHAVSVSLPKWQDVVDYEEGRARVVDAMQCGYPRFFFHHAVRQLFQMCAAKFGTRNESCILVSSREAQHECRAFLNAQDPGKSAVRLAEVGLSSHVLNTDPELVRLQEDISLFIVLFDTSLLPHAKAFWQHTGEIISSRFAVQCLRILKENELAEETIFLEERFGRNLEISKGHEARDTLKARIAGLSSHPPTFLTSLAAGPQLPPVVSRPADAAGNGVATLTVASTDVFLYPSGMSAIYTAFKVAQALAPGCASAQFGFAYTDTIKIQQRMGVTNGSAACHLFARGDATEMEQLEVLLQRERIAAIFTEFPSNPLLGCADLHRLSALARRHHALLIIDDTVGNLGNVHVLPYADIVVTSLTKVFSGDSNVMGGSLVINPLSPAHASIHALCSTRAVNALWNEDAIFLERNSRTFLERNQVINRNAEALADWLHRQPSIQCVYYPKYTQPTVYQRYQGGHGLGYGGLMSIAFHDARSAHDFFDRLQIAKGPSLGTNFTLACPYTLLAHYHELEFVESVGVPRDLIRMSIGMEPIEDLIAIFEAALR
ncbi:hypothetical protein CXG81DRAFT_7624, partial [Caulochytrium protostelioides]